MHYLGPDVSSETVSRCVDAVRRHTISRHQVPARSWLFFSLPDDHHFRGRTKEIYLYASVPI